MTWLRVLVAVFGVILAGVAFIVLRDNKNFRMALLELNKARANNSAAAARSRELAAEQASTQESADYHRKLAQEYALDAKILGDAVEKDARDLLRDMPLSQRVERFKRRVGISD